MIALLVAGAALATQTAAAAPLSQNPAPEQLWRAFPLVPPAQREPHRPLHRPTRPPRETVPPEATRTETAPAHAAPTLRRPPLRPPLVQATARSGRRHVPLVAILAAALVAALALASVAWHRVFRGGIVASGVSRSRTAEVGLQIAVSALLAALVGWLLATLAR